MYITSKFKRWLSFNWHLNWNEVCATHSWPTCSVRPPSFIRTALFHLDANDIRLAVGWEMGSNISVFVLRILLTTPSIFIRLFCFDLHTSRTYHMTDLNSLLTTVTSQILSAVFLVSSCVAYVTSFGGLFMFDDCPLCIL